MENFVKIVVQKLIWKWYVSKKQNNWFTTDFCTDYWRTERDWTMILKERDKKGREIERDNKLLVLVFVRLKVNAVHVFW